MAAHRDGMYFAQLPEPDDSGIDSDDTERARAQRVDEMIQLTESSSSDEDPAMKVPWIQRFTKKKFEEQLEIMEEGRLEREILIPMVQWQPRVDVSQNYAHNSPDRYSPPLIEVELTASDEDDDNSVLELVIPLPSNYKRPTSTWKRVMEVTSLFCTLLCCFR
ncbi:uncharacterized protein LOC113399002 [Vanessa tameamea]|uniref:Uncharacterized protein LOC113399002 n=1 Tax=Vanessa tameamea TaxID=334116 RepID=A0A8B8I9U1_VANTA|nr:uncharacterized protein LOC113399002 [Vanessa tameamea]XP_026493793.1 uncharacterized protein LOC113399002 [Vanessa tameamea]